MTSPLPDLPKTPYLCTCAQQGLRHYDAILGNSQHLLYQYKREPLTPDEANRLASACETHQERLIVWTLLDTGLRVAELAGLTREHIDWQNHRLMIYGKDGPYGTKSKRRLVPLTDRVRPFIENHFALYDTIGMTPMAYTIAGLCNPVEHTRGKSRAKRSLRASHFIS